MKDRNARPGIIVFLIVMLLGGLLGGGVWLVVEFGKVSKSIRESELRLAAVRHVCGMIGTYVEKSGYTKWPRSWDDLQQGAEDGGYIGGWSPRGPRLQDLVTIDFDADLKTLQQQEAPEFTAVRLTRGVAATSLTGEFESLLARIRGPVKWPDPQGHIGSMDPAR